VVLPGLRKLKTLSESQPNSQSSKSGEIGATDVIVF
jgi:hypothetical protein